MLPSRIVWILLTIAILFFDGSDAWWRRRRRRRCNYPCEWKWSSCSKPCGGGTQYTIKTKNQGSCGSCNMPGRRRCNAQCCPVHCSWHNWGSWSKCSVSCGGGHQTRTRTHRGPSCGGRHCSGSRQEIRRCNAQCCPVNCIWSSWQLHGGCSAKCGGGIQVRRRFHGVKASCGGADCRGSVTDTIPCNAHCCSQDCVWGDWGSWSTCNKSCGGGIQTHTRIVATPASCGGQECRGPSLERESCNTQCCVIDCMWSDWATWSSCSKSCDTGEESRRRKIVHMSSCGGRDCTGRLCETRLCNQFCCPSQCEYSVWSQWNECDKACGNGTQIRQREYVADKTCSAQICREPTNEQRSCNPNCCPVDCVLSDWTQWSDCSATCGTKGKQHRTRTILQEMECDGKLCDDELNQEQSCNNICFQNQSAVTASGCACANGWKGECCEIDINECDNVVCPDHSDCVNSDGSYECVCRRNYTKERQVCLHFDKCASGRHKCHAQAECTMQNMEDYVCKCNPGYTGDGYKCTDIDECIQSEEEESGQSGAYENFSGEQVITDWFPVCHGEAKCINTEGSYTCECNSGFVGDGWNCKDFDECELADGEVNYCDQHANCNNTYGSYYCSCMKGYFGDGRTCQEINECDSDPCKNGGSCVDMVAKFTCECKQGYKGDMCSDDINECADGTHDCADKMPVCRNVPGGYECDCESGRPTADGECPPPGTEEQQAGDERQENMEN